MKRLGRWYSAELKDVKQVEQLKQDAISGLRNINNTSLPGKLKLWCFQFGLPRLMWPISIYEVTVSHANRLERLVNAQVRKWLGLPRCLSSIGLYGNGALSLPVSSLVEDYKCAKARLEMTSLNPGIHWSGELPLHWQQEGSGSQQQLWQWQKPPSDTGI